MPNKNGRVTESEVAAAVLKYLAGTATGDASVAELVANVPNHCSLSSADRERSGTRPNEELWEQQVRNIISHRDADGNFINDGLLAYAGTGLSITDAGRKRA